jgi:chloramphenicol 3-O-phosphotransferase
MAALTATLVAAYDSSAGKNKTKIFTVTPSSASDTVALATWFDTVYAATCYLTAGLDANLTILMPSVSTTTVTIVQKKADGATNADDWTSASITIVAYGTDSNI